MPVRYVSVGSGSQALTLNQLIAAPTVVAERFISITKDQFVMEKVLRGPMSAPGGAVQFRVSSGIFADNPSEIVNERAEIPLATVSKGDLQTAATRPNALGVSFSWEMLDMDITGEVNRQIQVVKNTIVRDIDGRFYASLSAAVTQTRAATAAWSTGTATIRKDINAARLVIQQSQPPGAVGGAYLQYNPDTLLINPVTWTDLMNSTEFLQMIYGTVNPSMLADPSQLPMGGMVLGLTPLISWSVPAGTALVCESKTIGGYADRVPLGMSELYDWNPARISRADAYRDTVAFVTDPSAGCRITGI